MAWSDGESKRGLRPYQTCPARVVEALRTARNLLADPARWLCGRYRNDSGARCLEAAIRDASDGDQCLTSDAMRVMREVLHIGRDTSSRIRSLFDWNDAPRRTHDEVLAALDDGTAQAEWIMNPREVFA